MPTNSGSVFLLGAGASVDAGIPASTKLAEHLIKLAAGHQQSEGATDAVRYVYSALMHEQSRTAVERGRMSALSEAMETDAGSDSVDVEKLLRAVDLLARRRELEIRPFIASWDATLQLLDASPHNHERGLRVWRAICNGLSKEIPASLRDAVGRSSRTPIRNSRGDVAALVAATFTSLRGTSAEHRDFTSSLTDAIQEQLKPGDGGAFVAARHLLERLLCRTVWLSDASKVGYLDPLLRQASVGRPLVVATLNYDNCVELSASNLGLRLSTRVKNKNPQTALDSDTDDADVILLKLHGSANWKSGKMHVGEHQALPQQFAIEVQDEIVGDSRHRPLLIFGQESKLTAERPFFDLFLEFRDRLRNARMLTVIGYSWRDDHINAVIRSWLARDYAEKLRIIDPKWTSTNAPFARELKREIKTRISGNLVEVIEKTAADAIEHL